MMLFSCRVLNRARGAAVFLIVRHVPVAMPSKSAHLIAFLVVFAISAASHRFVYVHVRALIRRDFSRWSRTVIRATAGLFILLDLPFIYLFLSKWLASGHDELTRALLYPFSLWQALMLFWTIILLARLFVTRTVRAGTTVVRQVRSLARENPPESGPVIEPEPIV
jgi:hypothetical protein